MKNPEPLRQLAAYMHQDILHEYPDFEAALHAWIQSLTSEEKLCVIRHIKQQLHTKTEADIASEWEAICPDWLVEGSKTEFSRYLLAHLKSR